MERPAVTSTIDLAAEQFHIDAVGLHQHRLIELVRQDPLAISVPMLVCVYDLLAWSVRLREDVRGLRPPRMSANDDPIRDCPDHIAVGAKCARDQIVHGRGLRITALRSIAIDDAFEGTDVLFNDPEVGFNGFPTHATIRLVAVEDDLGDRDLRRFFNTCVAGRRVIVTAGLLTGQRTLGNL